MEQNNDNQAKEMAKVGVKLAIKKALTPIRIAIWSAVLTVLPYIIGGLIGIVLLVAVYYGTIGQIDQIFDSFNDFYENSRVIEEKIKNAVSLHGFKTNEQVEHDEETKYFKMLNAYKKVFISFFILALTCITIIKTLLVRIVYIFKK